jgi:hypothetical protein
MSTAVNSKRHAADCPRFARSVSAPNDRVPLTEMVAMWPRNRAKFVGQLARDKSGPDILQMRKVRSGT